MGLVNISNVIFRRVSAAGECLDKDLEQRRDHAVRLCRERFPRQQPEV